MGLRNLSIIQYQNVSEASHLNRLWLPLEAFERQLAHLAGNGFEVLSMDEATDYMEGKRTIREGRPISLTFDNGYRDLYVHVFPLLARSSFPSTLLICPGKVGKHAVIGGRQVHYMDWEMLRDLIRENVSIGAYEDGALSLNDIPEDRILRSIVGYKRELEDRLGVEIRYFGVKEGVPNPRVRDLLVSEGYRAFLTECPTNQGPDLFAVGRIQVDDDDFNIFLTKISRTYLFFKDKKSWKYIREYSLDRLAHRISETYDKITSRRLVIL